MKEIKDLVTLTDKELLAEFADRYLAYEESATKMFMFRHNLGLSEENCENSEGEVFEEWENLRMEHDEDFCLLREITRFVKKDDSLLAC